ncbi:MAG TPA: hypothetical protein VEB22_14775 [Phycisphaerales bacterium]|nr:hypothetical protein [Phycisphaerales bacterium]
MGRKRAVDSAAEGLDIEVGEGLRAPEDPDELAKFVRDVLGAQVAARAMLDGSDGPLAYLVHSFFEGRFLLAPGGRWKDLGRESTVRPPGDCVVWANRGGGKTFLGAVATALDMLFKRGIEVRILGGSAEQSRRMHEHLRRIFEVERLAALVDGRSTDSRVRLRNGSRVEILAHSERSVRGVRVQKLRCDEVDLFDPELWQAAQLVTRSTSPIDGPWGNEVRGVVEVLSTMHVPMGLMWNVVRESRRVGGWMLSLESPAPARAVPGEGRGQAVAALPQLAAAPSRVLFKWGVVDSLEHCGPRHTCPECGLLDECGGQAKGREQGGHMTVRDAQVLKRRVSRSVWETEMLCREPSRSGCVFPEFSRGAHVMPADLSPEEAARAGMLVAGMDFGVRSPSVVVWAALAPDGSLTVIDEYGQAGRTLAEHVAEIKSRPWGTPAWVGIDPAGCARNEQTGTSNLKAMKHMGIAVKARRAGVADGIESVRSRLAPASGPPRLRIAPRCAGLIEALSRYHYPPDRPTDLTPVKDGSDHWCDALRYLVTNLDTRGLAVGRV